MSGAAVATRFRAKNIFADFAFFGVEHYCLLPIAYCLLPIAYCLLPIAYCLDRMHTASTGCILPYVDAYCMPWMHTDGPAGRPAARPAGLGAMTAPGPGGAIGILRE